MITGVLRRVRAGAAGDGGAIAAMVPFIALLILLLGGLVIDASRQLNARGRATAYAEEAARAGASAIVLASPTLELDRNEAIRRAQDYCDHVAQTDPSASCEPTGIEAVSGTDPDLLVVAVHAQVTIKASLLGMVGVTELHAEGYGRARPVEGIDADGDAN